MKYHNILHDDMRNGDGLRVTLFVSGCDHHCENCQNPQTWDPDSGILFDQDAKDEIFDELDNDYISGITISGGDPLYDDNLTDVLKFIIKIKREFPEKTVWIYTGHTWEYLNNRRSTMYAFYNEILKYIDVLVDGRYMEDKKDVKYHWAGSTNQRVIDVKKSLESNTIVLYK